MNYASICAFALSLSALAAQATTTRPETASQETALARSAPAAPGARVSGQDFVLAAGEHDLRTLITAAASYLGRNILVTDDFAGEPKVTLQVSQKLDRDGCLAVVTQLAYIHGLVMVPMDRDRGMWQFININGARRNEALSRAPLLSLEEVGKLKGTRIIVTTIVPVQHVRATAATQTLRPFFATGAPSLNLGTAGAETAVMLSGFVDEVLGAAAMLAAVDQPPKEREALPTERLQQAEARIAALEARLAALEKAK